MEEIRARTTLLMIVNIYNAHVYSLICVIHLVLMTYYPNFIDEMNEVNTCYSKAFI